MYRACLVALLTVACGGDAGSAAFDQPSGDAAAGAVSHASGSISQAGESQGGGVAVAGGPAAGADGVTAGASGGGAGGAAAGQAGAPVAGAGAGGSAGKVDSGAGGSAGAAQAGAGGQTGDPLEPKPLDGCPGYVTVFVPKGTCVWFHGTFTVASETCSVNPAEGKCGTASAITKDLTSIVSTSAEITRLDLDPTMGCPKKCN